MAWSLHTKEGKLLPPLQFSTGKTQEDIVNEIKKAMEEGHKVIFLHGQCGSGKSAIALNLAKECGRASIVVPVKYLQKQYEEDYTKILTVKRKDKPLSIAILTGRGNHPCLYNPASTAEDRLLPCSIDIKKENMDMLKIYIQNNEFVKEEEFKSIDDIKRLSVAPACPYWSPIIAKDWFAHYPLPDATKHEYQGLNNRTFTIFQRKPGCSYYQQFHSYRNADVLIFNAKKYEIETMMDRKPATDIEIIDECDEFLDNLGNERKINLTILEHRINVLQEQCKEAATKEILREIQAMISSIIKSRWLKEMMDNKDILKVQDTKIYELMQIFAKNEQLLVYEELEQYFVTAKNFEGMYDTTYTAFSVNKKGNIICSIVNVNLEKRFNEFLNKNKVFIMMSGTLQTTKVLKEIFGIKNFKIIEAETQHQGKIIRSHTRLEKDFRYRNFESGKVTREEYLKALDASIASAELPALVHINSFADLPTEEEKAKFNLSIMSREKLEQQQEKYKKGELLQWFKEGKMKILYSTKCNRGVDLPGDMCKSIVFTKYPFPPMSSLFWRVLKESQPEHFMEFYFDKARREFLQRIYRGLRSKEDKVMLLSPDSQVLRSRIE